MKCLVMGLPGSGKTTLSKPFAELIGAVYLNADEVRKKYDDWDFTIEGRLRQAYRMTHLADGAVLAGKIAVADFVCPTKETRDIFNADYTIFMDTIKKSEYEDTNSLFEPPEKVNYHVAKWFDDTHQQLLDTVQGWMQKNESQKTNITNAR